MTKKKTPVPGSAKGTFPLDHALSPEKVVSTVTSQLASVQACADYPNQAAVQASATTLKGSLANLAALIAELGNARALVSSLETERNAQCVVVRRDHAALQTSVNTASQGVPKSIVAWGATLLTTSARPLTTDAPLGVVGKALGGGAVRGQCTRDKAAMCYLFQVGTDPANPSAWPPPVVSNGCRHTFTGTLGQKLYFRVAIQRSRSGLGQWSDVVEVTVR